MKPYLINFPSNGDPPLGYISVAEKETLPFEIRRVYWTYYTPENVSRGGHAHYKLEQILIAAAGSINVDLELLSGQKQHYLLDKPNVGLSIPKSVWRTLKYSHNAVRICLASSEFLKGDCLRDYLDFKELAAKQLQP